ncbi:phosphoribosylanthranilate isomerase [Dethiosulfatibacter aminovorans DSM 17477]|uniref:N-(5'-phosphoribosyl)anthranilate isomerase n=1 Tax=Dethiosulfatibacter aminovorans DSM 17477 TaxID=1121476 RepID=A0A1M6J920_9FIRM|nr:phosphoribosylanthranilate isomerase [Dethiosulfatibacter aminovorans]SHJ43150.1 phosphoribosylanthranilate isomerase [Dethiosulfatibacter aminovorans DSM 17477]
MIKVKICGLRTMEDIKAVNKYRPDYVGFVLADSKRKVCRSHLKILLEQLDKGIIPVGVFVNHSIHYVEQTIGAGIKVVQLHGDENDKYIEKLEELKKEYDFEIWKAVRLGEQPVDMVSEYLDSFGNVDGFLLDKLSNKAYGGLGEKFSWERYRDIGKKYPIVLAGGLNEFNVMEGLETIKPFCVDVSSGVETKGSKDPEKIRRFIELVRTGR